MSGTFICSACSLNIYLWSNYGYKLNVTSWYHFYSVHSTYITSAFIAFRNDFFSHSVQNCLSLSQFHLLEVWHFSAFISTLLWIQWLGELNSNKGQINWASAGNLDLWSQDIKYFFFIQIHWKLYILFLRKLFMMLNQASPINRKITLFKKTFFA